LKNFEKHDRSFGTSRSSNKSQESVRANRFFRFLSSPYYQIVSIVGILIVFLPITFGIFGVYNYQPQTNIPLIPFCLYPQPYYILAQIIFFFILSIITLIFSYKVMDAFFVKAEIVSILVLFLILYIIWIIGTFTGKFSPFILDIVIIFVSLFISIVNPVILSFSLTKFNNLYDEHYRKMFSQRRQSTFSTDSEISTRDDGEANGEEELGDSAFLQFVLEHEVLSRSFEKFAVQCRNTEALYFYKHVQQFKKIKDNDKRLEEAKKIAKDYLAPEASFEIKIPPELKNEIIQRIEKGNANVSVFHRAEVIVFAQMRHSSYPLWRKSKSFRVVVQQAGFFSFSFFFFSFFFLLLFI